MDWSMGGFALMLKNNQENKLIEITNGLYAPVEYVFIQADVKRQTSLVGYCFKNLESAKSFFAGKSAPDQILPIGQVDIKMDDADFFQKVHEAALDKFQGFEIVSKL
jgi:hypothetical protein